MKFFCRSLFFLFLLSSSILAQDLKHLNIIVQTQALPQNDSVFVTGDNPEMGNWNPSGIMLNKISDILWTKEFTYPAGSIVEFKITRGSWNSERINDDETVPANTRINLLNDTTITFVVKIWADQIERKIISHGQITGSVEYIRGIKGEGILPRDIIIWLPPGYEKNKKERYSVIYMHDGQNIIDPATSSFGYDWRIDEVADSLIKAGKIKPVIIVGIYSTSERSLDYGGSKDSLYMNFVVNRVKPLIDKKYRTLPGRKDTFVTGSSLGGLISFLLVWNYPNVFSGAACLSPAFHIQQYNCLPEVQKTKRKKPVRLYLDIGGIDLEKKLQPGVDGMLNLLKAKGYVEGKDLEYFRDPVAEHNEQNWAKRNRRWLEFLLCK